MVIGQIVTFLKSKIIVNSLHKTYTGLLTSEGTPWVYIYGFDWYSKQVFFIPLPRFFDATDSLFHISSTC